MKRPDNQWSWYLNLDPKLFQYSLQDEFVFLHPTYYHFVFYLQVHAALFRSPALPFDPSSLSKLLVTDPHGLPRHQVGHNGNCLHESHGSHGRRFDHLRLLQHLLPHRVGRADYSYLLLPRSQASDK